MNDTTATGNQKIDDAIAFTKGEDYLRGLTLFLEVYGTEDAPPVNSAKIAGGLSYFGLCLALVQKKYKTAIDLCRRALELQFYSPDHYANLTRVYAAAGNRRKAVETIETALRQHPDEEHLIALRNAIGVRARPALPFLDRSHPINVTLGQARHAKKVTDDSVKKPKA